MKAHLVWSVLITLAVIGGAALGWEQLTLAPLRAEVEGLRIAERELARERMEQRRLEALAVTAAELERLRADRAAIGRVRSELADLRRQRDGAEAVAVSENLMPDRLSVGQVVPVAEWKNRGANTPPAALETALWAAAGGDVPSFAALLWLDVPARTAAQRLLDRLSPEMRAQYDTPERLLTFLSIQDIPLGSVQVRGWSQPQGNQPLMTDLTLTAPDGKQRDVTLPLFRVENQWKLIVVERTVAKYAAMLQAPNVTN